MLEKTQRLETPKIPEFELIRPIGRGACGEVWLARNVVGSWRAVKVTYRSSFTEDRPFLREFEGIKRFEPISRTHPGLVAILHVGRSESGDSFYSVMELADDIRAGQAIDPDEYVSRTLRKEMDERGRLPSGEAIDISIALAAGLSHLHGQGLIHRDIKPSNIIFVKGVIKFADIGLVAEAGEAPSHVGTPGYMPPEGPGGAPGDIYSLGKVLYELSTGNHCKKFPELPLPLSDFLSDPYFVRLNNVVLKACNADPKRRYQNAEQLHQALLAVKGVAAGPDARPARIERSDPTTEASTGHRRPLVCFIDDDEDELEIFQRVFERDFQIITGTRFNETLPHLRALGVQPDLFILDLYFPAGRDATHEEKETMQRLRSEVDTVLKKLADYCKSIGQDREGGLRLLSQVQKEFSSVPVVFYTRKGTIDDVTACLEAGARDVIRKPQPEAIDPKRDLFAQLMEAAAAHRGSLLTRFESFCSSRSFIGKLFRVAGYVRKNWSRF